MQMLPASMHHAVRREAVLPEADICGTRYNDVWDIHMGPDRGQLPGHHPASLDSFLWGRLLAVTPFPAGSRHPALSSSSSAVPGALPFLGRLPVESSRPHCHGRLFHSARKPADVARLGARRGQAQDGGGQRFRLRLRPFTKSFFTSTFGIDAFCSQLPIWAAVQSWLAMCSGHAHRLSQGTAGPA